MTRKFQRWWKKSGVAVLPCIFVVLLTAVVQTFQIPFISPVTDRFGLLIFDTYQRLAPREYEAAPVRIIDIDDETIERLGQWPWPRTDIARLTLALSEAGAAAIAYDIVFSEEDRTSAPKLAERFESTDPQAAAIMASLPDNDEQLASVLAITPTALGYFLTSGEDEQGAAPKAGMVVLGSPPTSVPHYGASVMPLEKLSNSAAGLGSLSIQPDSDSVIRRAPLIAYHSDHLVPALSLEALRIAFQTDSVVVKTTDASGEGGAPGDVVALQVGSSEVPTNAAGEMWMHYTEPVPERIIPAWKVLEGELSPEEIAGYLEGQIVYVGTSAIGLRDLRSTPLNDRELGVMVHAQATEQMITNTYLSRPDWAIGLERFVLLVLGIGLAVSLPALGAFRGALLSTAVVFITIGVSWYAFIEYRYLLNPTWIIVGLVGAYLVGTIMVFYREERQRAYIHNAFDRYLSPELVRRIADDPEQLELGGEEREMTVMFCDIRSFSRISEQLSPNAIIGFLIAFLTPMTELLLQRKATIDKYIGDAILAFWNAPLDDPEHHENAARGALEMVERLKGLNDEMQGSDSVSWPENVRIGIGLNSGPCCVGNMGSEQRLSYSLIGDTVNLASRIEGLTKYYGVQIAIGNALRDRLPHFALLELDRVRVVGRESAEPVFVLLGNEALAEDPDFSEFRTIHEMMLEHYRQRQWHDALAKIERLVPAAPRYDLMRFYELYIERISYFLQNDPGRDWDGVFTASEK